MNENRKRGRPKFDDILTPAEWRVVEGVRHGMSNRQIAEKRGISIDAVKYHVANAVQKLALNNRLELRNWTGIARASALAQKETSVSEQQKNDQFGTIGQISRHVRDITQARDWYADVLGLTHLYSFGDLAFFDCSGVRLFLSQSDGDLSVDSIVYFNVADVHAAHKNMESRGISFLGAPHMVHKHEDGTEEWMAFFNDPEGRPLAIMSRQKMRALTEAT